MDASKRGWLYTVVGPSGVGKDSLINAVCAIRHDILRAKRVITRPAESGGEDFEGVDEATFNARSATGEFAIEWQAHGLSYGVPRTIEDRLREGRSVIFNGSRGALCQSAKAFPGLHILLVTATPATLAKRLAARGRETEAEIEARLKRANYELPTELPPSVRIDEITNDGAFEDALAQFLKTLHPERG